MGAAEDRRLLEIEVEQLRREQKVKEETSAVPSTGIATAIPQGFNVGLAKAAGLPVDLANFALSAVGLGSEEPVGGSKFLQQRFADVGVAPEPGTERETLGMPGRITEEIGAAAVPFGAMGTAVRAGRTGGTILKPVLDFFKKNPTGASVAELASATGAGVGGAIAQEAFPDSPIAEFAGQLLGGLVSSPSIIAEQAPHIVQNVRRSVKVLSTEEGATDAAAQVIQKSARSRQELIKALEEPSKLIKGAKLTVGQETGDAGMLSLERSARKKSEDLNDAIGDALTQTNRAISENLDAIGGRGSAQTLKATLEEKVNYLKTLLTTRTQQSMTKASDDLSKLAPNTPREQTNVIVRREIDGAYDAGRAQEKELWNAVPKETMATVNNARGKFADILSKRDARVDNPEDIPNWLRSLFKGKRGIKGDQSLGRVQRIRSRVLTEMRAERGKEVPNRNKVRIYAEMADSLLDDMAVAASDEVALARAFSNDFNQRFTQGAVGDILGYSKTGEPSLSAASTLEGSVGRPGPVGGVAIDDINRAVGVQVSPEDTGFQQASESIRDFIADRFIRRFPDGKVNTTAGRRFIGENREALARNPALRKEIEQAIKSQDDATRYINSQKKVEQRLGDRNRTAAEIFINGKLDQEIRAVFSSKNPQANMRMLVKRAVKDKTGEAMQGLRSSVLQDIRKSGLKNVAVKDLAQQTIFNGIDMQKFVTANRKAIAETISVDQLKSLDKTIDTAVASQRRLMAGFPGQEILDESPDALTDLILSVVGANIGGASAAGQATGAPLVMAQRGASAARNFGRKWISKIPAGRISAIIDEAILDRDLMKELLKRPKTVEAAVEQVRALRGFLINTVPEAFREPIDMTFDVNEEQN